MRHFMFALAVAAIPVLAGAEAPAEQTSVGKLGADGALVLPFGDWSDVAGVGIGATLHYDRPLNQDWTLTGRLGYIYHAGKDYGLWETSFSTIPIMVGAKYNLNLPSAQGLYLAGELGLSIISASWEAKESGMWGGGEQDHSSTDFGMTLGAGYAMGNFDFAGRFYIPDFDVVGLMATVGYNFTSL